MPTNFPTSLDSLSNPSAGSSTTTVDHAAQHSNANDAIEAIQAKVGADSSAVTSSHDYKIAAAATKLATIETNADVTDAANVDAAGAVMNSDTSTAAMSFVIDEDNMASNSATKVPTQQSVKAYVDASGGGPGGVSDWGDIGGTLSDQTDLQDALDDKQDVLTGLTSSVAELNILDGVTASATELNYVDGVTSAIQTQLDAKASSGHTHLLAAGATDVTASAAELNALDGITATVTELNYTDGVTSAIQTQLDAKSTASKTETLTNKTIDANGTGNAISNLEVADLAAGVLDTDLSSVAGTDTTIPSAKATKTALDLKAPLASPTFTGTVTLPTGLTGVVRADSGVVSVDTDVTDIVSAASDTAAGKVELATTAETTTGTDATRAVTPDGLHDMTSLAGAAWFLDEDNMASNSDTKTASQQSIKAYADTKQPLDSDLTTIAGLTATTDNFIVSVASAWASRTPSQVRTTLALVPGTDVQAYDATLLALAAYNTNGILTQTAADTFAGRTITGTSNQVSVSNGNGVSGNPTLSTPQDIHTGANPTFNDLTIDKLTINETASYDAEFDNGNSSTADTIDWGVGNVQKTTLNGDCTYTFTAPAGPAHLTLRIIHSGASRNPTWPATVKWAGGAEPTWSSTDGAIDIATFFYNGTNYYGAANTGFA